MGMWNAVQNTVTLLAAAKETHTARNAANSTADAIAAILLLYVTSKGKGKHSP